MTFTYPKRDFPSLEAAEQTCWLLTNGLGGYSSSTAAFSSAMADQCLLVAAKSPSTRFCMVQRLQESLQVPGTSYWLSSQNFAEGLPEDGWRQLECFTWDNGPRWELQAGGVHITRQYGLLYKANTAAVVYTVRNDSPQDCVLTVTPAFQLQWKGGNEVKDVSPVWDGTCLTGGPIPLYVQSSTCLEAFPVEQETYFFPNDAKDGRRAKGIGYRCVRTSLTVPAGGTGTLELTFSDSPITQSGRDIVAASEQRLQALLDHSCFRDPVAKELSRSADAFLADRANIHGQTIVAGYPFFGDWGRDTMIALPGCVLALRRYDAARSILHTFLSYEKDGLVPNLFPEGQEDPAYNSADAPLLLINSVWLYYQKTGDTAFVREAWPALARIVHAYQHGTRYAIAMDADGLIQAGSGLDQVTWMDVCIDGILPTPRHGKPVEINAYWYNALCVLRELAPLCGEDPAPYAALAEKVKASFGKAFWLPEGRLKDVINGTYEERQIRCNQIWAVSMPFTMLSPEQEKAVVDTVFRHLWTPNGLRTLSREDPAYHPTYGGTQKERDLAYHQGTVWPFPLGAWYLAYLKVHGNSAAAAHRVRQWLQPMEDILREGCVGQIPEIYDGDTPGPSKGCFAQAWSVGEILRVYEALEAIESTQ